MTCIWNAFKNYNNSNNNVEYKFYKCRKCMKGIAYKRYFGNKMSAYVDNVAVSCLVKLHSKG